VNYLRYNGDEPRYFAPRSSDEDENYLRINGDGLRYFAVWSSDEDVNCLRISDDELSYILHHGQVMRSRDTCGLMVTGLVFCTVVKLRGCELLRYNGDEPRYFAPRSSDEDVNYLRIIGDEPSYILHRGQGTRM